MILKKHSLCHQAQRDNREVFFRAKKACCIRISLLLSFANVLLFIFLTNLVDITFKLPVLFIVFQIFQFIFKLVDLFNQFFKVSEMDIRFFKDIGIECR